MPPRAKMVVFRGGALDDLRASPPTARREAGYQIDRVQAGRDPDDWKPMASIGTGVREVRIREPNGAFRVIYLAKFADKIFVLHGFQKKSAKTSREDVALAKRRFGDLMKELAR